jgi:succinate dehydrogenase / fumarate reductase membrane anchor subunit
MAEFQSHRIETPLKRVRGLGAAHTGTEHFWRIRLTSLAQVPLTIAFLVIVIATVGKGRDAALATLSHPLVALLMLLFIVTGIDHMRMGMQVIIEDYVHEDGPKIALLVLNAFFAVAVGLACVLAVLKISFGA